ncbi:hypothetical protein P3L10_001536 [Capsicum annuum]
MSGLMSIFHQILMLFWLVIPSKVTTIGENDRFSIQLFSLPKPGHFIEAPKELVDEEHPLLFKPFEILGLFEYIITSQVGDSVPDETLKAYCGV